MKKAVIAAALLLVSGALSADQVTMPIGTQTRESTMELPKRAINKEAVRKRFGDPQNIKDPVGEPPISSWEYPAFVVYFENDLVLHAVVKR